jgi:hypothetical protein
MVQLTEVEIAFMSVNNWLTLTIRHKDARTLLLKAGGEVLGLIQGTQGVQRLLNEPLCPRTSFDGRLRGNSRQEGQS